MIRTFADLLDQLRSKELAALAKYHGVGHQGMIGDMYEGLTRHMLSQAIFDGLDLRVATGKIRAPDGTLSRQIDAMLVVGPGERLPFTEHDIYAADKVIAAVEVKKTLYGEALSDAYENLLSLSSRAFLDRIPLKRLKVVFRRITMREVPSDGDLTTLPWHLELFAHTLIHEVALPVRIVLGYDGYVNEKTLRDGLLEYLSDAAAAGPRRGYGPAQLPSLVICGNNALLKLNGMPYSLLHDDAEWWLVYGSMADRPGLALLEVLWTRIVSHFGLSADVFGEDLELERINPLLFCKPMETGEGHFGWTYRSCEMSLAELRSQSSSESWEPVQLNDAEATIIGLLCGRLTIDTRSDPSWASFVRDEGDQLEAFLDRMRLAGLAAVVDGEFVLLTDQCQVVCTPDRGFVAAENSTGRLTRWILNRADTKTST